MFLDVAGRAAPSADNAQATLFFMVNDEGVWLIERPRGRAAVELFKEIPPRWEDRTEDDWLAFANAVKRKVYDGRFEFPRAVAVLPGLERPVLQRARARRCFLPVVDITRQYINVLLILLSEPNGKAPLFVDDWQPVPAQGRDGVGGVGGVEGRAGGPDPLPADRRHQARARRLRRPGAPAPLGSIGTVRTDYEAHFLLQNLMLTAEALRLGGWVHGAPMIPYVWQRDPAHGRTSASASASTAPSRATRAGSAGRRCPPRSPTTSASTACSRACARRTSPTWTRRSTRCSRRSSAPAARTPTPRSSARPTRTRRRAEALPAGRRAHPPAEAIEYTKEICRYLVETYGRFPAHTDAFHLPGIWVQFSHLEIEYYERFGEPGHARRQAEGREIWDR